MEQIRKENPIKQITGRMMNALNSPIGRGVTTAMPGGQLVSGIASLFGNKKPAAAPTPVQPTATATPVQAPVATTAPVKAPMTGSALSGVRASAPTTTESSSSVSSRLPTFTDVTPEEIALRDQSKGIKDSLSTVTKEIMDANNMQTLSGATGLQKVYQDEALAKDKTLQERLAILQADRAAKNAFNQQNFDNSIKLDAARTAAKKASGTGSGTGTTSQFRQDVSSNAISAIDKALEFMNTNTDLVGGDVGGFGAGVMSNLFPSSKSGQLNSYIKTIKSNVGQDQLQKMREASKTGGALGQVTEKEMDKLEATIADLDVSGDPRILRQNLGIVRDQMAKVNGLIEQVQAQNAQGGGQSAAPAVGQSVNIGGVTIKRVK